MNDLMPIRRLYSLFDHSLVRPKMFFNLGCCVSTTDERPLLKLPREQLSEAMLAHPTSHYGSCFGTFEQVGYFVPRLIELLATNQTLDDLNIKHLFSMLIADREEYEKRCLWQPLIEAIAHAFWMRTESFTLRHLAHHGHRLPTGRALDHLDYVVGSEILDAMLGHFLCPALMPDSGRGQTFWEKWVNDLHPPRIAHLLDMLKRRWEGNGPLTIFYSDIPLPVSIEHQLGNDDFVSNLLERIEALALDSDSPTWRDDFSIAAGDRPST